MICNKTMCGCDTWKGALKASTDRCRVVDTESAMGLGLKAMSDIPKGLIIGWYSGRTVSYREEELIGCNRVRGRPSEYTMYIGNGYCVDGENDDSNVVKYANHECTVELKDAKRRDLPFLQMGPNCTFEKFHDPESSCPSRSTRVALVANVDIAAGSWCTVDYGDLFCVPKPCLCKGCIAKWLNVS